MGRFEEGIFKAQGIVSPRAIAGHAGYVRSSGKRP